VLLAAALCAPALAAQSYPRSRAIGSTYVPLHSWVYPAIERLAALRYIRSEFRGSRPWTRTECARLTDEAGETIEEARFRDEWVAAEVSGLYESLEREFRPELEALAGGANRSFQLESAYARVTSLSGPVLNDGYHFGQTVANDYGRPFRRGTNVLAGGSLRATYGPWFAYGWAEFQHSPAAPALSDSQRQFIARVDNLPLRPAAAFEAINRFRALDSYVGVNIKNWQLSFGRQSLWWGTSESGPLLLSNNPEPISMIRLNRAVPFKLPSFLGLLGPMRVDFFAGRLGGHEVAVRPWLQGQRISFKILPWWEFGVTHTAVFGGAGRPDGLDVFFKTLFPFRELEREAAGGESLSDQHMSFDFLFRARRYFTWYGEFLGSDDPQPFNAPRRMAVNTGLYFPRLPLLEKTDLRLEGVYTSSPCEPICPGEGRARVLASELHYWHYIYRSGYTNNGTLLGNSVGRDGLSYQAWLTHWFSPTDRLALSFKRTQLSSFYVAGAAQWSDFSVRHERQLRGGFHLRSSVQVERVKFPFLFSSPRTSVAAMLELGFSREMSRK
jgi:hypothetical protein